MWKDFFYYSKSERRAVCVLLTLIVLFIVAIVLLPEYRTRYKEDGLRIDAVELNNFAAEIQERPRKKNVQRDGGIPVQLVPFDPNLADSIELSRLGLSKFVVNNILKYRQKGGRFATPESLSRIYGLTEEKFHVRLSDRADAERSGASEAAAGMGRTSTLCVPRSCQEPFKLKRTPMCC